MFPKSWFVISFPSKSYLALFVEIIHISLILILYSLSAWLPGIIKWNFRFIWDWELRLKHIFLYIFSYFLWFCTDFINSTVICKFSKFLIKRNGPLTKILKIHNRKKKKICWVMRGFPNSQRILILLSYIKALDLNSFFKNIIN